MFRTERIDTATSTRAGLTGLVLGLLVLGAFTDARAQSISLVPVTSVTNVQPGETVKFNVEMDFTDDPTVGGGFDISFDPAALQFVSFFRDTSLGDEEGFGRDPDINAGLLSGWCVGDFLGFPTVATLGYVEFEILDTILESTDILVVENAFPCGSFISAATFLPIADVTYNGSTIEALETHIAADGVVTNATGALAELAPVGSPITGSVWVNVERGATVGPANIQSIDLSVNGQCFTTQSPTMCPTEDAIVPINSIDDANFIVDVASDTGLLAFTAYSSVFEVDLPVSINLDSNTASLEGGDLGSLNSAITFIAETDDDGIPDVTDPDDDNDNVRDGLDTRPAVPNNHCSGGDADNATLVGMIMDSRMCAANVSVTVQGETNVIGPDADLRVIAPSVVFQSDFSAERMSIFSEVPCADCLPGL